MDADTVNANREILEQKLQPKVAQHLSVMVLGPLPLY